MKNKSKKFLTTLAIISSTFALTGCFDSSNSTPKTSANSVVSKTSEKKEDTTSTKPSTSTKSDSTKSDSSKKTDSTSESDTSKKTDSTSVKKTGTVTLTFDSSKGTVTADKESGDVGDTITLTVTANDGYTVKGVKANDVVLTGPTYSFVLVEGENTVEVTFEEAETPVVEYNIVAPTSTDFEITELTKTKATKDEVISFKVVVKNDSKEIEKVTANLVELEAVEGVYSFTMPEKEVILSVTLKDKAEEVTINVTIPENLTEGAGAEIIKATLSSDATATDWVFNTDELNGVGVISELPSDHPDKADNVRFFTPANAGTGTLKISCTVNGKTIEVKTSITVNADYTKYTEIKSASDFIALIEKGGTITDKYYLSNNIDLGGRVVNGRAVSSAFNGVLDGRGHCVKNFEVKNTSDQETNKSNGLFYMVGGTIRNIHLIGTISDQGFSGLLAKEVSGNNALIENCVFEATNTYTTTDWTWGRNGVIASVLQTGATVRNVVTKLNAGETGATCFPFFAYTWNANVTLSNAYTNIAHDEQYENYKPFFPNGGADYSNYKSENVVYTPFESTAKTAYTSLSEDVWVLEDNKMPVLKHSGDDFVILSPEVSAEASKTTISLKEGETTTTITASVKNTTETPTYSYSVDSDDVVEVTNNDDGTFTVKAKKAGTASITIKATIDGKEYTAAPIEITVKSADAPTYDIPEGAFEIKDAATFKQVFTGGGEYTAKDFYLSADIDLTSETSLPNNGMAGEFSKTFEGQGHTIKVSYNWGLFNIISATGVIRNVNIVTDQPSEANRGGICHTNSGLIENVNVAMTVTDGKATNTFAGVCYLNNGTIKDSNVDFTINTACNTVKSFAVADGSGTFTNCTYSVSGSYDGKDNAVIATSGTTLVTK